MKKVLLIIVVLGLLSGYVSIGNGVEVVIKKATETIKSSEAIIKDVERKELCDWCDKVIKHEKLYRGEWYSIEGLKSEIESNKEQIKLRKKILESTDYFGKNESMIGGLALGIYSSPAEKYIMKIDFERIGEMNVISFTSTLTMYPHWQTEPIVHNYQHTLTICPECHEKITNKIIGDKE